MIHAVRREDNLHSKDKEAHEQRGAKAGNDLFHGNTLEELDVEGKGDLEDKSEEICE